MKKVISFSLWGIDKIYLQGAFENIKLAKRYYKGWDTRFYVSEDCPALKTIQGLSEVIIMPPMETLDKTKSGWENSTGHIGSLWRFLPLSDLSVERMVSRDTDSRISSRCYDAVCEWENSGMLGHVIRECESHCNGIQCGMIGSICNIHGDIKTLYEEFIKTYEQRFPDQRWVFMDNHFARIHIIEPILFSTLFHGYETNNPLKIPQPPECGEFIGAICREEWRGVRWVPSEH